MKLKIKGIEYRLENKSKVHRAIHGTPGQKGEMFGGVGVEASPLVKITEYDRLGGFITCIKAGEKAKVKTGSFYDFKAKAPRKEPKVAFVFRDINGDEVELDEEEELPLSVRAKLHGKKKAKAKVVLDEEDETEESDEDSIIEDEEEVDDEIEPDLVDGEEIEEVPVPKKKPTTGTKKKK